MDLYVDEKHTNSFQTPLKTEDSALTISETVPNILLAQTPAAQPIKSENISGNDVKMDGSDDQLIDPLEIKKEPFEKEKEENLFTQIGLQPSPSDLDQIFEN